MMRYILLLMLSGTGAFAQDPLFYQTGQSLNALNPSFAGSNGFIRFQSDSRLQWPDLQGSYTTCYNSFDAYLSKIRGGIALNYIRDNQARGTLVSDRLELSYAQHISLSGGRLKLIPSVQAAWFRRTLDWSKLNFGPGADPRYGSIPPGTIAAPRYTSRQNLDLAAGLVMNYNHFYAGLSLNHMLQPDEGMLGPSKLPSRFGAFASYNLFLGERSLLHAIYRFEKQQNFIAHQLGVDALLFRHLLLGAGYRSSNTLIASAGFRHAYFTVSAMYELSGNPAFAGSPSYELCASFNLRPKAERKALRDVERW